MCFPLLVKLEHAKQMVANVGHVGVLKWIEVGVSVPAFIQQIQSFKQGNIGSARLFSATYNFRDSDNKNKSLLIQSAWSQLVSLGCVFLGNITDVYAISSSKDLYVVNLTSANGSLGTITLDLAPPELLTKVSTLECKVTGTKGLTIATYPDNIYQEQTHLNPKVKTIEHGAFDPVSMFNLTLNAIQKRNDGDETMTQSSYFSDMFQHIRIFVLVESIHRSSLLRIPIRVLDVKKEIFKVVPNEVRPASTDQVEPHTDAGSNS